MKIKSRGGISTRYADCTHRTGAVGVENRHTQMRSDGKKVSRAPYTRNFVSHRRRCPLPENHSGSFHVHRTLSCGAIIGHTIRQALPRHVGMLLSDVISGIVGIEIFEQQRRAAVIRGHRPFLIAQDLSIEFVDESVHGCV